MFKPAAVRVDAHSVASAPVSLVPAHDTVPTAPPRLAVVARWVGDLLAVALLAAVLWWFAEHDGGREPRALLRVALLAVATAPWAVSELRRLPRSVIWLVAAWSAGAVASVAFGAVRAGFPVPVTVVGLVSLAALAGHRVWRRPWGPVVVLTVALAGFGQYWYRSFLQWWGSALLGDTPRFMALSWHNQSGILMGAFAALFAGLAFRGRQFLSVGGVVVTAMALSATWLSTSRAASLVTFAAVAVVAVASRRQQRPIVLAGKVAATAALTVAVTVGMSAFAVDSGGARPTGATLDASGRESDAGTNALLRLEHMEAAVGMFAARPLTGQGLGGYRWVAQRWNDPDGTLTSSAHNEYAESLGEGGLAVGLPFLVLTGAAAVLVTRRIRGGAPTGSAADVGLDDVRGALTAGTVGVVVAIGAHSGFDFDWDFPVLPAFLAVALGALAAERTDAGRGRVAAWPSAVATLAVIGAVALGVFGLRVETQVRGDRLTAEEFARAPVPWDVQAASSAAATLGADGHHDLAVEALDRSIAWNPGVGSLSVLRAVTAYQAGDGTATDVAATLRVGEVPFWAFNTAAEALIDGGDGGVAREVLETALTAYPRYEVWGITEVERHSRRLFERIGRR